MARLAAENPDDMEASILQALVTSANFDPADKTYAKQWRAADILEPLFATHPDHPGVAHFLIHTYDYPPLAERGLAAADRYAGIAPDAVHALHMPSHIFVRLGRWEETAEWNERSADAALRQPVDGVMSMHYPHALDYMMYAYLQLGQEDKARETLEKIQEGGALLQDVARRPRCLHGGCGVGEHACHAGRGVRPLNVAQTAWACQLSQSL
jgi:hypothetical protein